MRILGARWPASWAKCRSSIRVRAALPQKQILSQNGDGAFVLWEGHCYVHQDINPELVHQLQGAYLGIAVLAHPECTPDVLGLIDDDKILSTEGMIQYVRQAPAQSLRCSPRVDCLS